MCGQILSAQYADLIFEGAGRNKR